MLASALRRTVSRAPHRVLILNRSTSSTAAPPPLKNDNPKTAGTRTKVSDSHSSPTKKAAATDAVASTSSPESPAVAESSKSSNPEPPVVTTVKALRGVRIDPEERQWHATVVHGRGVLDPYRHPRTHGVAVASIQFRAHFSELVQLATHFASHAAASLGIPISGVVSLPTRRTLWTVPRGPFAHKKSQENFERRVHARAIKAFDADDEVVDRWVRYLEAHALPGVGMRVVRWHRLPVGIGRSHLQSVVGRMRLGTASNRQKMKELGDKIVKVESEAAKQTA